jgi:carbonic anhydrase
MNDSENYYSKRRFIRHGLTLAGMTFAWGALRSSGWTQPAESGPSVGPDEALAELLAGNKRYMTGENVHHDFGPERSALAQSQRPFAIILGCADSRVSPELALDQTRGRLFVVRLAGNFVDDNGLASIEYGASVLGASLIMVLGHDQCGALKAAVDVVTKNAQLPGHLPKLIAHLRAPVEKAQKQAGSLLDNAIRENVLLNVETLRNSKPVISELIAGNRLRIVGGLYDLASGRVVVLS